jgi:hypothetical protein
MLSACFTTKHKETIEGVYLHGFNSFGAKTIELYLVRYLLQCAIFLVSFLDVDSSPLFDTRVSMSQFRQNNED